MAMAENSTSVSNDYLVKFSIHFFIKRPPFFLPVSLVLLSPLPGVLVASLGQTGALDRVRCPAPWLVASTWPACARGCRAACAGGQLLAGLVFCYQ